MDPSGAAVQAEAAALRETAAACPVVLPGGVPGVRPRRRPLRHHPARHRHLSFGHGTHYCLGTPPARFEAVIALRALQAAYPDLTLAVPGDTLPPLPGFVGNSVAALPVRLADRRAE